MNIRGTNENISITNPLRQLNVTGISNNIIIQAHVGNIDITGTNNSINGLNPNCLVDSIMVSGIRNEINLNQNCSNVSRCISGLENKIKICGYDVNNNNNSNAQFFNGHRVIRITSNNNVDINNNMNQNVINDINNAMNQLNNFGFNINNLNNFNNNINNNNNNNNNNNDNNNNNNNINLDNTDSYLSQFDDAKKKIILEMDEFQYKHIQRYDSRKETECAICLNEFIRTDIIKAFYKCDHIFHKRCLLEWLKKSDCCPLCKHDLKEDMNQL